MQVKMTDFANDKYIVLKAVFDHQAQIGNETFAPLSQTQVAEIVGFAKPKTNQLMQQLTNGGYIELHNGLRGKYKVTEAGLHVIRGFEEH